MSAILVIDDEKGILRIIHQLLTDLGYDVETAANGQEGIQKFDSDRFDIVITDIRMPVIDGHGVVAHIRKSINRFIPVIAMSGTPWLVKDNAFDMVIAKPFSLKKLVESIQSLVPVTTRAAVGT
jgi:two-component system response regulator VanR